jgi:hypothetical protein
LDWIILFFEWTKAYPYNTKGNRAYGIKFLSFFSTYLYIKKEPFYLHLKKRINRS